MSNYLSNLIGRSIKVAKVIRPRPTSLFEPSYIASAPDLGIMRSGMAGAEPAIQHRAAEPSRRAWKGQKTQHAGPRTQSNERSVPQQIGTEKKGYPIHPSSTITSDEPDVSNTQLVPTVSPRAPIESILTGSNESPAANRVLDVESVKLTEQGVDVRAEHSTDRAHGIANHSSKDEIGPLNEREPGPSIESALRLNLGMKIEGTPAYKRLKESPSAIIGDNLPSFGISHEEPQTKSGNTVRSTIAEMLPENEPFAGMIHYFSPMISPPSKKAAQFEPSIKVTIGRIDVHAVTQPERPAKRSETKEMVLSLDEYLRSRNGGTI